MERYQQVKPIDGGIQENTQQRRFPWSNRKLQSPIAISWNDIPKNNIAFLIQCIKRKENISGEARPLGQLIDKYDLRIAAQSPEHLSAMQTEYQSGDNFDGFETKAHSVSEYRPYLDRIFSDSRV